MHLRPAREDDAPRISALITSLSHFFTVSPTGDGAEEFFRSIGDAAIRGCLQAGNFAYLVAEDDAGLAGVAALRDNAHLYHLFVAAPHQGRGLGRLLWSTLREAALHAGNAGRFTVNASPNAVPVYERFGFVASGPEVRKHGIRFVPMRLDALASDGSAA